MQLTSIGVKRGIPTMRICRFAAAPNGGPRVGYWLDERHLADLSALGAARLDEFLESATARRGLPELAARAPRCALAECTLLAPVELQEVWAAGLTHPLARTARMVESPASALAHNLIYEAERPKIFFKSLAEKVVGTEDAVGVRSDSKWNVPEPELALVLDSKGQIVGHAVANDMGSRDIEGENVLYSPQAKIYHRSCAIGPWVLLGASTEEIRAQRVGIAIHRLGVTIYSRSVALAETTRAYEDLVTFLYRCQRFPHGALLLTGTGIVAPESVNLLPGDRVEIEVTGIGTLRNSVVAV